MRLLGVVLLAWKLGSRDVHRSAFQPGLTKYRLLLVARYSILVIAIFPRAHEIFTSPKSLSINRDFPYIGLVSRYIVRKSVSELHHAIERSLYEVRQSHGRDGLFIVEL